MTTNGSIPRLPSWCTQCVQNGSSGPCEHHRGKDGEPREYRGRDVYKPSPWVLEVIGKWYRHMGGVYFCSGYDPRCGFWMLGEDGERRNVSEAAIDRTFHKVRGAQDGFPGKLPGAKKEST